MKIKYIKQNEHKRLLLIFAGWGMDETVFKDVNKEGYDIAVVYDYRDGQSEEKLPAHYEEIAIIAWSMGVYMASLFVSEHPSLPVTGMIAVNGSPMPIHDGNGIPEELYLKSVPTDERDLKKFYRRVCGGASGLASKMPELPHREVTDISDELLKLREHFIANGPTDPWLWDKVLISDQDLIFSPAALHRAWSEVNERVTVLEGEPHLPDFAAIADRFVVDKQLVGERFMGATVTYDLNAGAQRQVAQGLADEIKKLPADSRHAKRILEVGSGTGLFTSLYLPLFYGCRITLSDLYSPRAVTDDRNVVTVREEDAEAAIIDAPDSSIDIFLSSSTIQWFNSPLKFIKRVVSKLAPGGRAYISFYNDRTFPELGNRSLPSFQLTESFLDTLGAVCSQRSETIDVTFETAVDALKSMRATGVNSLRRQPMSAGDTRRFMRSITAADGRATLHYTATYLLLEKK